MAAALAKGGLYVLGLHLTPECDPTCDQESWSAQRGHLAVRSRMWSLAIDRRRRQERVAMRVDVSTPTRQFRLAEEMIFRTYTAAQFARLLRSEAQLELVETYDFAYDVDRPVPLDARAEDTVFVLRKN
ncbi:MAG: hypothetical protein A2V70_04380 [Planctomycetes bacterium RBG_13_63_9]|nr:MAG: hypothetical protein A2V70_04380 [Planctomycetes bacterium RBG_13_63_9]